LRTQKVTISKNKQSLYTTHFSKMLTDRTKAVQIII
jgi:hypothetical protein